MDFKRFKAVFLGHILLPLIFASNLMGQAPVEIPDFIPPSPSSAGLGKYGNVPVNLHSGSPNITIPLYEIVMDDIQVPISLSFHASGHKVRTQAGWVGLGWSLNAGGVVNRSMRGEPDEDGYFASIAKILEFNERGLLPNLWKWLHENPYYPEDVKATIREFKNELAYLYDQLVKYDTYYTDDHFLDELQAEYDALRVEYRDYLGSLYAWYGINDEYLEVKNWMHSARDIGYDTQADIYNFNYPGGSGTFMFKPDQSIAQIPFKDDLIEPTSFTTSASCPACKNGTLGGFNITNKEGITYTFEDEELTQVLYPQDAPVPDPNVYESSWYLSSIFSQRSGKSILFSYSDRMPVLADNLINHTVTEFIREGSLEQTTPSTNLTTIRNDIIHLDSISWEGGSIEFVPSQGRFDRELGDGVILDSIIIKDKSNNVLKSFVFEYNNGLLPINDTSSEYLSNHLLLTSVTELNQANQAKPPHTITYHNPENIPPRNSNAMDHDGFYNAAQNTSLVPDYMNAFGQVVSGADRSPQQLASRVGMVKSITYPTGGKTEFDYENHDIWEGVVYETQTQTFSIENCDASGILFPNLGVSGFDCIDSRTVNLNIPQDALNTQISIISNTGSGAVTIDNPNDYYVRVYDASNNLLLSHSSFESLSSSGILQENESYRIELNSDIDYTKNNITVNYDSPATVETNTMVGGLRISAIRDYVMDETGLFVLAKQRSFQYYVDDANRNKSSGILLTKKIPEYSSQRSKYGGYEGGMQEYRTHSSSGSGSFELFGGGQVAYLEVREVEQGNGYIDYHYSNQRDETDVQLMELPFFDRMYISQYPKSMSLTSSAWKRGHLIDQIVVDEAGNRKSWVHNDYSYITNGSTVSFAYETIHEEVQPQSIFTWSLDTQFSGWARLNSTTTTTYENASESTVSVSNLYDLDDSFILPTGREYSLDGINDYSETFSYLNDRTNHIISPVTQMNRYDDQDYLMHNEIYTYSGGKVEYIDKYLNGSVTADYTTRLSEYNGLRPSYVEGPSGVNVVYLWGYGKTLPVAKILNIDYSSVETLLGSNLQNIENSFDNSYIRSQLLNLKGSLSGLQSMNIYLHQQGIGVVEEINANGVVSTFHYDAFNRLHQIKDQDGHVLKEYEYNYSN